MNSQTTVGTEGNNNTEGTRSSEASNINERQIVRFQHSNFQSSTFQFATHQGVKKEMTYNSYHGDDQNIDNLRNWILLDSQSTVDIFCNGNLQENVHKSNDSIVLYTNTREMLVNMKGKLKGYGMVWFDNRAMVDNLRLHNMKKKYRVTYDSWSGDKFIVHKPDKEIWFIYSKNGLYFNETKN